ncbi:MAG: mucoidy inhibitor MuiA family protein [Myxococcota bacterium]
MSERTSVSVPVREVTVLEDRASVTRRGRVSLPAGRSRLQVRGVAPVLVDKTLQGTLSVGAILDARVGRRTLSKTERDDDAAALQETFRSLKDQIAGLHAQLRVGELEASGLRDALRCLASEISDDVAWGKGASSWDSAWTSLEEQAVAREVANAELRHTLEPLEEERRDLARRIEAASMASSSRECWIDVDVELEHAGEAEIRLEYLVPSACWRPIHRATLKEDTVLIETDACVWQQTGEDWDEAILHVSTERPSLGAEPPGLAPDVLRTQKKSEVLAVEMRDQTIETSGLGEGKVADELVGVDDGGEVRVLKAEAPANVPSDGRPHRIRVGGYEAEVERSLVAIPEKAAAVLLRTVQVHQGPAPLLAGPVVLIGESGPIGRTKVLFVAPGERFELGWGPDPRLRVHRTTERLDEKSRMLSSWIRVPHRVVLKLSNLSGDAIKFEVTERVPVSEVSQVTVEVEAEHTSGRKTPDRDGMIRWQISLGPRGQDTIRLGYTLARKSDVQGV